MQIAKTLNGAVTQVGDYRELFPDTSFPASGPSAEWMQENGVMGVTVFKAHDRATEKLVSCAPYVEGNEVFTVTVEPKTDAELAADTASKAAQVRSLRDALLSATDWRFRSDLTPSQEWKDYCQDLRDIPAQAGFPNTVEWPVSPDAPNAIA